MNNIKEISNKKMNIMYSRVSSLSQEHNTSLDYQQSNLMNYCKDNNVSNNIHITDVDSGAKERKGIVEIKHLIKLGLVDTIYITKLDRLYRSIVEGSSFIKYCLDNKVNIKTTLETTDTSTSAGMLQVHLLMSIADYERKCIADRTWSGKVSTFNKGSRCQGNIPFGYTKSNDGISINDDEAAVIKSMFDTYRKFNSIGKVKSMCDDNGYITKRGNSFSRKSIYNILTNRYYVGLVHLQGEYKPGTHQPIVSKNIQSRVIKQLTSNKKG
tara:strand:+ start:345 stop:1151 length:807 start_codon:yes stop_codon:yes gene_type:complete